MMCHFTQALEKLSKIVGESLSRSPLRETTTFTVHVNFDTTMFEGKGDEKSLGLFIFS
jgi:hypothetical protein